jgi:hypothetical protein
METFQLLEKYSNENIKNFSLRSYDINGSIIRLTGFRQYDTDGEYEVFNLELLDYITWVWNFKQQ